MIIRSEYVISRDISCKALQGLHTQLFRDIARQEIVHEAKELGLDTQHAAFAEHEFTSYGLEIRWWARPFRRWLQKHGIGEHWYPIPCLRINGLFAMNIPLKKELPFAINQAALDQLEAIHLDRERRANDIEGERP